MRRPRLALALFALPFLASNAQAQDAAPGPLLLEQPKADYAARRKALMERVAESAPRGREPVIVVRGEDDRGKEDFEEGRFRQRNDFAYLTGTDVPGAYLILLPAKGRSTLYLPPKVARTVMNGDNPNPAPGAEAAALFGVDAVEPTSRFFADLFAAIGDPLRSGTTPANPVFTLSTAAFPLDPRPEPRFVRFLREGAPNAQVRDLAPFLGEIRKIKTPAELALLQRAIDITGNADDAVMASIRPGLFEYQLEARVHGAFTDGGALRAGFASIVGSGPNGTIPHYFANARKMADGDLVVVDVGAEYALYTADITRTFPVNGKFTPRQRELYQLVLDAQTEAERHMKPGVTRLNEMTGFVREYLRKSPLRARDENGQEQMMDRFFIHGLSHYLGMDVHDVGDTSRPMQPGEVFTIEPGLYLKSENIGIRIEDDYLMTARGPVKLSKGIPSTPDEIESRIAKLRAAGR